jgi:hypothetical protein
MQPRARRGNGQDVDGSCRTLDISLVEQETNGPQHIVLCIACMLLYERFDLGTCRKVTWPGLETCHFTLPSSVMAWLSPRHAKKPLGYGPIMRGEIDKYFIAGPLDLQVWQSRRVRPDVQTLYT